MVENFRALVFTLLGAMAVYAFQQLQPFLFEGPVVYVDAKIMNIDLPFDRAIRMELRVDGIYPESANKIIGELKYSGDFEIYKINIENPSSKRTKKIEIYSNTVGKIFITNNKSGQKIDEIVDIRFPSKLSMEYIESLGKLNFLFAAPRYSKDAIRIFEDGRSVYINEFRPEIEANFIYYIYYKFPYLTYTFIIVGFFTSIIGFLSILELFWKKIRQQLNLENIKNTELENVVSLTTEHPDLDKETKRLSK